MKRKQIFSLLFTAIMLVSLLATSFVAFAEGDSPLPEGDGETKTVDAVFLADEEDPPQESNQEFTVRFIDWNGTVLSTQKVSFGGNAVAPENPHREGYAFLGWDKDYTNIEADITITARYRALNSYTIAIRYVFSDGSTAAQPFVATVGEGYALNRTVNSPVLTGYVASQVSVALNYEAVTTDATVTVVYTPATGTPYVVIHRQQNIDRNGYVEVERTTFYGKTGDVVQAPIKSYTGFVAPIAAPSATIAANGSTVLVVDYMRKTSVLYFDVAGGSYVEPYVGYFGTNVPSLPVPTRKGYTFIGWDKVVPAEMPAADIYFTAIWQKNPTATYTVYYWLEKPLRDTKEYTYLYGETLTGNVDEIVPVPEDNLPSSLFPTTGGYERKNYFALNEEKTNAANAGVTIAPEGTTVVNVYIDRVVHTFTFAINAAFGENARVRVGDALYESGTYSYSCKYGENISDIFPDAIALVDADGNYLEDTDKSYVQGYTTNQGTASKFMFYVKATSMPTFTIQNGKDITLTVNKTATPTFEIVVHNYTQDIGKDTYSFRSDSSAFFPNLNYAVLPGTLGGFEAAYPSQIAATVPEEDRNFYFNRKKYDINFYSDNAIVHTESAVWYQEEIENRYYTPTAPADKVGYTFGGWYTIPACIDGTEYDFTAATMPSKSLDLYAKWVPPVFMVKIDPLNGGNIITQNVQKDSFIEVPQNPVKEGYVFMGWREASRDVQYMMSNPVIRDLNLVAIWVPEASATYKVSYKYNGADLVQPDMVTGVRIGDTITAHAKAIDGYLPDAHSKSLLVLPDSNEIVFIYEPFKSVSYVVRYQDINGSNLLPQETYTTSKSYVAHNFKKVANYSPIETQLTLLLTRDASLNVITFIYVENSQAPYRVEHYLQNTSGVNYYLANSYTNAAYVGNQVTASSRNYTGFAYNSAKSTTKGVVTQDGKLVLKLYYDRTMVKVIFMAGEHGSIEGITYYGDIRYGTLFKDAATVPTPVPEQGYMFGGWTPELLGENDLVTQNLFYTATFVPDPNATISVRYHANGGTGVVSADENLHVGDNYTVKENGFTREGYVFQGWQTEASGGAYYKAGTPITLTGSMDLYARWSTSDVPVVNPDMEDPDSPDYEALNQQTLEELKEAGIPIINIGDTEVPLYGMNKPVWALLNLLLAIASLVTGIMLAITWCKRNDSEEAEEENADRNKKKMFTWARVIGILLAIIAPVVFFLTENMRYLMVIVDKWTPLMAIFLVVQIVSIIFFRKRNGRKETLEEV